MASNSEAVLYDRCRELGLEDIINKLMIKGWTSQGVLAFATTYVPNQPNDDALMEQVINPLLGEDKAKVPLLRRLWFEAYSATMIEIKQRVTGHPDGTTRKMTQPELVARRKATEAKVPGIKLRGELDVSDDLIGLFDHMATTQTITSSRWRRPPSASSGSRGSRSTPTSSRRAPSCARCPASRRRRWTRPQTSVSS